jgi:small-conductance mechanosensitive channel
LSLRKPDTRQYVAASTGSGKTTLTNAIIDHIEQATPHHRLVVIEDTAEIQCTVPVVCGAMLIWGGEINEFVRRFIMVILVVALLVFASNILSTLFGVGAVIAAAGLGGAAA